MAISRLRRRSASLGTALGLGIALPFAVGATPAYAQPRLTITKTRVGDFVRGGQGVYRITVTNTGDEPTSEQGTQMTDALPDGLTLVINHVINPPTGVGCTSFINSNTVYCTTVPLAPGASYTVEITANVASDAPCTVTNTASVVDLGGSEGDSASDTTPIPGGNCNATDGNGDNTSILPVYLSGLVPIYNNINTNTNFNSPGASNTNSQTFGATASAP